MTEKPPFKSVTIPEHPRFLPPYLQVIVFETCVFCKSEIDNKPGWYTKCPAAPLGVHQKRIIIVDIRPG